MAKKYGSGWWLESHRHSLAAKGIRTVEPEMKRLGLMYGSQPNRLIDANQFKFGSVAWQNVMKHNISVKIAQKEPLDATDKVFIETQKEHNKLYAKGKNEVEFSSGLVLTKEEINDIKKKSTSIHEYMKKINIINYDYNEKLLSSKDKKMLKKLWSQKKLFAKGKKMDIKHPLDDPKVRKKFADIIRKDVKSMSADKYTNLQLDKDLWADQVGKLGSKTKKQFFKYWDKIGEWVDSRTYKFMTEIERETYGKKFKVQ